MHPLLTPNLMNFIVEIYKSNLLYAFLIISFYRSYFVSTDPQEGNMSIVFVYAIDADRRVSILQDKKDDLSKYK